MNLGLFFGKLTAELQLGSLSSEAVKVTGGLMHKMYRLNTSKGVYVVKLLNPNVMKRPDAMCNYAVADRLECIVEKNDIPIVPALTFFNRKMQELDGQFFYVYEWYDGKALQGKDITKLHCREIGKVLSRIHRIDQKQKAYQRNPIDVNWDRYRMMAKKQNPLLYDLLNRGKDQIDASQRNGNKAIQDIPDVVAICHNDMDSKNVLWYNDEFKIIDLECLSYANPYLELFELALCWSGYEECSVDFELFEALIAAYFGAEAKPDINWESLYDSNYGRLEWLEYNVKRALLIECDTIEEQALGMRQVKETIEHVLYYHSIKEELLRHLHQISNSWRT